VKSMLGAGEGEEKRGARVLLLLPMLREVARVP
jgi:hypothetical protein